MEPSEQPDRPAPKSGAETARGENSDGSDALTRLRSFALHVYRLCDGLTEATLYFMVIFYPWAFGTTQTWSIWVMNYAGYSLGMLLLAKRDRKSVV